MSYLQNLRNEAAQKRAAMAGEVLGSAFLTGLLLACTVAIHYYSDLQQPWWFISMVVNGFLTIRTLLLLLASAVWFVLALQT